MREGIRRVSYSRMEGKMDNDDKKEKIMRDFRKFDSPLVCVKCLNDPACTTFDSTRLISFCIHKNVGQFLLLVDFQPQEPVFLFYPTTKPEFLSVVALLNQFMQWIKKSRSRGRRRTMKH
mgnify:CR=1 FL=1